MQEIFLNRQDDNFNMCEQKAPWNEDEKTGKQSNFEKHSCFLCSDPSPGVSDNATVTGMVNCKS